jgi:hypothetical protein
MSILHTYLIQPFVSLGCAAKFRFENLVDTLLGEWSGASLFTSSQEEDWEKGAKEAM